MNAADIGSKRAQLQGSAAAQHTVMTMLTGETEAGCAKSQVRRRIFALVLLPHQATCCKPSAAEYSLQSAE